MKINLRIQYIGKDAKEVTCSASDLVAFEDKFNLSVSKMAEDTKLSHLLFLAWHSETRTKATTLDFDAWVGTVAEIGAGETDPKSVA